MAFGKQIENIRDIDFRFLKLRDWIPEDLLYLEDLCVNPLGMVLLKKYKLDLNCIKHICDIKYNLSLIEDRTDEFDEKCCEYLCNNPTKKSIDLLIKNIHLVKKYNKYYSFCESPYSISYIEENPDILNDSTDAIYGLCLNPKASHLVKRFIKPQSIRWNLMAKYSEDIVFLRENSNKYDISDLIVNSNASELLKELINDETQKFEKLCDENYEDDFYKEEREYFHEYDIIHELDFIDICKNINLGNIADDFLEVKKMKISKELWGKLCSVTTPHSIKLIERYIDNFRDEYDYNLTRNYNAIKLIIKKNHFDKFGSYAKSCLFYNQNPEVYNLIMANWDYYIEDFEDRSSGLCSNLYFMDKVELHFDDIKTYKNKSYPTEKSYSMQQLSRNPAIFTYKYDEIFELNRELNEELLSHFKPKQKNRNNNIQFCCIQ